MDPVDDITRPMSRRARFLWGVVPLAVWWILGAIALVGLVFLATGSWTGKPQSRAVPPLQGFTVVQARMFAEQAGFTLKVLPQEGGDRCEETTSGPFVVHQDPAPLTNRPIGSQLTARHGPCPAGP